MSQTESQWGVMVTTASMRRFALWCVESADQIKNPSHRQHAVSEAKSWLKTAKTLDRLSNSVQMPDLRSKLN